MTTFEIHSLRFSGDGAGRYPLTWAQQWIWRGVTLHAPRHQFLNIPILVAVPAGCSVTVVLAGIAVLLGRHQALRARFGVDEHGVPFQTVVGEGTVPVEVHDASAASEADAHAKGVLARLMSVPFTVPEVAVRAALTTVGGQPTYVALAVFHAATDGLGARRLAAELTAWMCTGGSSPTGRTIVQTPARVAYEQSDQGMARSHRSVAFWEQEVARFPPMAEGTTRSSMDGPASCAEFRIRSRALAVAADVLADRFKISASAVLTGLGAQVLCRAFRAAGVGFLVFCHNRFDPAADALSGTLVQSFPMYVAVESTAAGSTEALLRRVSFALIGGSRYGQYDPTSLGDALERLAACRGWEPDLSYSVNIQADRTPTGSRPPRATIGRDLGRAAEQESARDWDALTGSSQISESPGLERDDKAFYLTAWRAAEEMTVCLRVDTARHSRAEATAFLKELEQSAVQAATSLDQVLT